MTEEARMLAMSKEAAGLAFKLESAMNEAAVKVLGEHREEYATAVVLAIVLATDSMATVAKSFAVTKGIAKEQIETFLALMEAAKAGTLIRGPVERM